MRISILILGFKGLKNFYSLNLLCISPSLLETKQNIASTKICQSFLASQVPVLKRNKAPNSSTSNHPFFSCNKNPWINYLTLSRLTITFDSHGQFTVGDNETNKTFVICVFIFIPRWWTSRELVAMALKSFYNWCWAIVWDELVKTPAIGVW